jgi:hypothetical protein
MPSAGFEGFEPAIPESERLQTHALDRWATEIGIIWLIRGEIKIKQHQY